MKIIKPLYLLLILFTISKNTYAQPNLINNSSFEEFTQDCSQSSVHFFDEGCYNIPDGGNPPDWSWGAASGRPVGSEPNDGPCDGIYSAVFAANFHDPTEGSDPFFYGSSIFYTFPDNLEPGNYTLSFCHEGILFDDDFIDVNLTVTLARNLQNATPPNPIDLYYEAYDDQNQIIPRAGILTQDISSGVPVLNHDPQSFLASFTVDENQTFDQLWFFGIPIGEGRSKICIDDLKLIKCEEDISCEENLNLTSCVTNNQTGYIDLWCGEGISYSLESPQGSNPSTYKCDGHFIITNATAGIYTVHIETIDWCGYSRTYEVIENCCTVQNACVPPEDLGCFTLFNSTTLTWDPVPGAIGYELYIYTGECGGPTLSVETILLSGTSYDRNLIEARSFEWAVRTVCPDETLSDFSELVCFDIDACNGFSEGFSESTDDNNSVNQKSIIFPNPNNGNFTLELLDYEELNLHTELKIFNQAGILVHQQKVDKSTSSLDLKNIPSGVYLATIYLDNKIISEKFIVQ